MTRADDYDDNWEDDEPDPNELEWWDDLEPCDEEPEPDEDDFWQENDDEDE